MSTANEPAFTIVALTGDPRDGVYCANGLTKREYFAAMEMLTDGDGIDVPMELKTDLAGSPPPEGSKPSDFLKWNAKWRAVLKVIRADALIAALEEKQ